MANDQTIEQVRELCARGLSPKQIARALGIRPAVASDIIRELAVDAGDTEQVQCLLSTGWSAGLRIDGHPEWRDPGGDESAGGLVSALVARRRRHRSGATVCVYLLDVWCLGVKNAMGPDHFDDRRLRHFTDEVFGAYQAPPVRASIELVRDLVLGAAEYARRLGFGPHPDFRCARAHLGPWSGPSAITFGHNGKPTYISGPHDDPDRVIGTLRRAVGRNGFSYTIGVPFDELTAAG